MTTLRHYTYDDDLYPYGFAFNLSTSLKEWLDGDVSGWCFDTFGDEGERWRCATGIGGHGYVFRDKEDATAFKLRWL